MNPSEIKFNWENISGHECILNPKNEPRVTETYKIYRGYFSYSLWVYYNNAKQIKLKYLGNKHPTKIFKTFNKLIMEREKLNFLENLK
jgi:hypothetical protein